MEKIYSDKKSKAKIIDTQLKCNFRKQSYALVINEDRQTGEIIFNEFGGIIDCKFHYISGKIRSTEKISVSRFKKLFGQTVERLVPEEIRRDKLSALVLGEEGIFKEPSSKLPDQINRFFRYEYLD